MFLEKRKEYYSEDYWYEIFTESGMSTGYFLAEDKKGLYKFTPYTENATAYDVELYEEEGRSSTWTIELIDINTLKGIFNFLKTI